MKRLPFFNLLCISEDVAAQGSHAQFSFTRLPNSCLVECKSGLHPALQGSGPVALTISVSFPENQLMASTKRRPYVEESLKCFKALHQGKITKVLDVGVQWGTPFLMDAFSEAQHYLVEPVSEYHQKIVENYESRNIKFDLIPIALSDENAMLILHEYDYDNMGRISHSQLRSEKVESPFLIRTSEVPVRKLDDVRTDLDLDDLEFIVKIDVDGLEEKIIGGGSNVLREAALVIVEAPLGALHRRLGLLNELGFALWDICDPAYYYQQLHQVDLVLINSRVRNSNNDFRPFSKNQGALVREQWQGGIERS